MKYRMLNSILLAAWLASLTLAGGCRSTVPAPPGEPTLDKTSAAGESAAQEPDGEATLTVQPAPVEDQSAQEILLPSELSGLAGLPFDRYLSDSFEFILLRDPEWVTSEGISSLIGADQSRLTDISESYRQESLSLYSAILGLLQSYDRSSLPADQQVSYDTYAWYLEDQLRMGEFRHHEYPVNPIITGIQYQLEYLFTDLHPLVAPDDADDYLSRLSQVAVKLEQLVENLHISQEKGLYPPQVAIQASLGGIQAISASSPDVTPFYTAFEEKLGEMDGLDEAERQRMLEAARETIGSSVIPAYRMLAEYLGGMRTVETHQGGVWQQPGGADYYQAALKHHTTTDMTPDEVHQLGLDALQVIQAEMRQRFDKLGYPQDEDLEQLFQRAAFDGGFSQGGQIIPGYKTLIEEANQNLDEAFDIRPAAEVDVKPGPGSTAFYVSPAVDGSRPGVFYAPLGGSEPHFAMPTLAYHEGVPGHHFQISLAQEMDMPLFRSMAGFTGYIEGWALYAERLAADLGWYEDDPYGDLGRLQMEAFRAARLVVDTGLHDRQWTFDQAVDFLVENTGLERGFIRNEVVRYLVWPGQAASYAVGYFKLLELRERAQDVLGEDFDLKAFHHTVLSSGSLPLEVLDDVVEDYITLASLQQVSEYPLYVMHYQGDYGFSEYLQTGLQPAAMDAGVETYSMHEPAWACTGFAALSSSEDRLMGRNFDWLDHPALLLFTDPPEGYASVSMVDLYYLGYDGVIRDDDRLNLLRAPYLPFDGMNEEGLAVGMMAVSEADSGYDPDRVTISDLNLIRLVLDDAADVDEAVALMGEYNIDFGGGPPIHYFLADASGNSAVVEFLDGGMQVLPNQVDWQVSTNFLVSKEQPVGASSSCWRYNTSYQALESSGGVLDPQAAMELLAEVSQPGDYATRWSVVYNMTVSEISLVMGREYDQVYTFSLDE